MKSFLLCSVCLLIYYFSFGQKVGIGTLTPTEKLQVMGNIKADTIKPVAIRLTQSAGNGKVLTSDANGNGSWQSMSGGESGVGYGSWGDCTTNAIAEYHPVADSTGASDDYFGASASLSGNFAIVGAYADDIGANLDQGSASMYYHNGTSWVLTQKLTDATGDDSDFFGYTVFVSGNYAIVGAPFDDVGTNADQGSASIFQYNGSSWVLMQKLTDATGADGDAFGTSVSISGSYAIIGSYSDDVSGNSSQGSASIFQYNGSSWVLMQKLTDATGAADDNFGYAVSISGNYAVIAAPWDNLAFADQGSVNVYQFNGTSWVFKLKLSDATGGVGDNFGFSVSISGHYIIVGAPFDNVGSNTGQGSALTYRYDGTTWVLMQKLSDPSGLMGDNYGLNVCISGKYAMVGAYYDDVNGFVDKGSATIYLRVGVGLQKLQYVTDPTGNTSEAFGRAVAIDANTKRFLVGAYGYTSFSGKAIFGKIN